MGLNSQMAATFIRSCLSPPVFANDENKTLIARALHFVTLWASATMIFIGINAALFAQEKVYSLLFIAVGLAVTLIVNWQMRQGEVRRASFMMVSLGWAIVTLFVFLSGGLDTVSSSLYLTVIIMAALFLGSLAGAVVVGLTLATMLPLALLDMAGYSLPRLFPLGGMTNWLVLLYIFILVLIIISSIESGLRGALQYAREQLGEREKAEKALRESEERFRLISSVTSDYTFSSTFDEKGELKYLMLTGAFEAITGYTPEEYRKVGGWRATLHPDDVAKDEYDMAALRQNQRVTTDVRIIRKDGQIRWARVYADPVWEAGQLKGINGAVQDITDRKLAEDALRESEERFRLISSITSDYTFSTGLPQDGRLEYRMLTGAFEAISGYTPEEYLQAGGWWRMLHPDDRVIDERDLNLVRQNQRTESEVRIIRKDGQVRWVRVYAHPVWDAEQQRVTAINGAVKDITEQKLAEDALRESEERFRLISSVTSDYTYSTQVGADGKLEHTLLTGAFEAISGYTPEEFLAIGGWRATVHPDDYEQDDRDMEILRKNQRVVTEIRVIKKDGDVRWVRVYAHPVWDAELNRLVGINGAVQDITERKLAENALRQNEKLLRALQDATTDVTFLTSLDGTFLTVNKRFADLEGTTIEEMIGKNGFDRLPPELRQERRQYFDKVIETKQPVRWVDFTQSAWWDNNIYPVLSPDGSVEAFAVYSRDITEQKRLEAEVEGYTERLELMVVERTAELSQAKDQIEVILNSTTDAVALTEADGDIQTANPAYYAMFGVQASQAIEHVLGLITKDEQAVAMSEAVLEVINLGEGKRLEVQIATPDKTPRDIDLALIPVRLRHDDPRCGILVSAHDITTLKDIQRFKSNFVANAIHDLGNPIQGLLMRIQVLKISPERLEEHINAMNNQIDHFRYILNDLSTLSHVQQNQLFLKLEASNINDMVLRVFDTYEAVALNKQQALMFKPASFLPEAWVDIRQLERAVINLVTNAINYTPVGKKIEIQTALDGDEIVISVKDQGIGMDSKEAAQIFERFYQAPNARSTRSGGSGLGLAIVKEIVELHGGSVKVKSRPGHGSTFTMRLPVQR